MLNLCVLLVNLQDPLQRDHGRPILAHHIRQLQLFTLLASTLDTRKAPGEERKLTNATKEH